MTSLLTISKLRYMYERILFLRVAIEATSEVLVTFTFYPADGFGFLSHR